MGISPFSNMGHFPLQSTGSMKVSRPVTVRSLTLGRMARNTPNHLPSGDPSLFFDDNGKAYIVHNDAPKQALWDGHRTIRIWEYDVENDRLIPDSDHVIVNGGLRPSCIWPDQGSSPEE